MVFTRFGISISHKVKRALVNSSIASIAEIVESKNIGIIGPIEFELAVVTKKTAGGKLKLVLVEAGADYQKEKLSKIKFSVGSKSGIVTRIGIGMALFIALLILVITSVLYRFNIWQSSKKYLKYLHITMTTAFLLILIIHILGTLFKI